MDFNAKADVGLYYHGLNQIQPKNDLLQQQDLYFVSQLEAELERRKELGFNFQQILQRQKTILKEDDEAREAHLVAFDSSLREAMRILKGYSEKQGKGDMARDFNDQLEHR